MNHDQRPPETTPIDTEAAIANAVRILQFAEDELANPQRMQALTDLGHSWLGLAGLLDERER
jgi:hypothetical protein